VLVEQKISWKDFGGVAGNDEWRVKVMSGEIE